MAGDGAGEVCSLVDATAVGIKVGVTVGSSVVGVGLVCISWTGGGAFSVGSS